MFPVGCNLDLRALWIASLLSLFIGEVLASGPPVTIETIKAAQRAVAASPESEAPLLSLADIYLRAERIQDAVLTLKPFAQAHSDSVKSLRLLALAYLRNEDYANARDAAERALRVVPSDTSTIEVLAMAYVGMQQGEMAMQLFRKALSLDADSVEANYQLGLLYVRSHRNSAEAIRLLKRAKSLQAGLSGIDLALGSAYLTSGDAKEAVPFLETAATSNTDRSEADYLLASAYRQLNQAEKAQSALADFRRTKAAAADQRAREMQAQGDYQRGLMLLTNSEDLNGAYASFLKAAAALPASDPTFYRMAQVMYLEGDLPAAVASIRRALSLNPLEPEYYFVLARCLQQSDRVSALQAIETAIQLKPGISDFEELRRSVRGY